MTYARKPTAARKLGEYARPRAGVPVDVRAALTADPSRLRTVALDEIAANPDQPRKHFDDTSLRQLAQSIRAVGILQPPVVADTPQGLVLIAGERRCRAARLAGLERIDVLIRDENAYGPLERLELALLENAAREDLTPIEEARTYDQLLNGLGLSQTALASRIGKSRPELANTLRLLQLPDEILAMLDDGRLTKKHGRTLLTAPGESQIALAHRAIDEEWGTRRLEEEIAAAKTPAPRLGKSRSPIALRTSSPGGWAAT
jgi:ParB family chromosome partitioning protein